VRLHGASPWPLGTIKNSFFPRLAGAAGWGARNERESGIPT
jgi:hypothetical protein